MVSTVERQLIFKRYEELNKKVRFSYKIAFVLTMFSTIACMSGAGLALTDTYPMIGVSLIIYALASAGLAKAIIKIADGYLAKNLSH